MTHFKSYLLALIAFITPYLAIPAQAVPVEERGMPRGESTSETVQSAVPQPAVTQTPPPPVTSDSYGTLQLLQQEVMELRGLVEQLSHQVRELRERQEADYLDLDRRISATAQPQGSAQHSTPAPISPSVDAGATVPTPPATTASTAPSAAVTSPGDEVADYSAAYGLLKQGKFEESKAALRRFIERYPNGDYAANAHYWLGEIYLLDNDLNEAVSSFEAVVSQYPAHRKAQDARFKLGKSYHLKGDAENAVRYLTQAADGSGSSADLARQYLADNF